jgi:hypothetical protein
MWREDKNAIIIIVLAPNSLVHDSDAHTEKSDYGCARGKENEA